MTAEAKSEGAQMVEAAAPQKEELTKAVEELVKMVEEEKFEEPKSTTEEKSTEPEEEEEKKNSDKPKSSAEEKKSKGTEEEKDDSSLNSSVLVEKSSSFKEESNFPSDLKEHERKALIELRSKIEDGSKGKGTEFVDQELSLWGIPLLPTRASESTDVVLLKFLRARDFKVKDAFEMLDNTLQWRKESKIDSVLDEDLFSVDLSAACYMDGVDREGHPVCYNVTGVFRDDGLCQLAFGTDEGREKFLRWRVQLMEKSIKKLDLRPGGSASLLQITDLKNSPGLLKRELRATMSKAVQLLQDNYPEFVARNVFINVPFWYYAFYSVFSPFLTQRTKSKMVIARPARLTETLLKYIPAEAIPIHYGGLKRENDVEFSAEDGGVSELTVKAGSTETVEITAPDAGTTLLWDLTVLGWEVSYKEEFVPSDEGSYTVIIQKGKKMGSQEEPVRNSFRNNEPGKVVLTIENGTFKKKKVLFRYKTTMSS